MQRRTVRKQRFVLHVLHGVIKEKHTESVLVSLTNSSPLSLSLYLSLYHTHTLTNTHTHTHTHKRPISGLLFLTQCIHCFSGTVQKRQKRGNKPKNDLARRHQATCTHCSIPAKCVSSAKSPRAPAKRKRWVVKMYFHQNCTLSAPRFATLDTFVWCLEDTLSITPARSCTDESTRIAMRHACLFMWESRRMHTKVTPKLAFLITQ